MKKLILFALLISSASVYAQQSVVDAEVPDRTASGTLGGANNAVTLALSGRQGVGGFVTTGTLSGSTIIPEVTMDGSTWIATSVFKLGAGVAPVRASSVTLNTLFSIEIPDGAKQARIRVSVYGSGTSTGYLLATQGIGAFVAANNIATIAGTAPTVPGFIDIKGADGDVFVRQTTAANLNVTATPVKVASSNNDGTCTSVSTPTTVLAAFATRSGATIMAQCDPSACNTDTVFIRLAATATTSDFPLAPGDKFIINGPAPYTGIIDAIANSGTQKVCVLEW